jgi:hypothetical protein
MAEDNRKNENSKRFEEYLSSMEAGTWSNHLSWIREVLEDQGKTLKWDADWMPVVIIDGFHPKEGEMPPGVSEEFRGKPGMLVVAIPDLMSSEEGKERLAMMMRLAAVAFSAKGMSFVSCVWMSTGVAVNTPRVKPDETDEEWKQRMYAEVREHVEKHGQPSQDPNRIEKLMIISIYFGGEDDGQKSVFADIKRQKGKPPELHNWKIVDETLSGFIGRFPDAIYEGLKVAWELRAREANQ